MLEKTRLKTKIIEVLPWSESGPEKKGWRGVLFRVKTEKGIACLKTLRGKIEGTSLKNEAEMLQKANAVGVGPKFIEYDEENEAILMELVDGREFRDWLPAATEEEIRKAVPKILEQAHLLDSISLDHGQLSWAPKHILIGEKITLVDFERASDKRKVNNLSSLVGFLLVNPKGTYSQKIVKAFGLEKEQVEKIRGLMKAYRQSKFSEGYSELQQILACWE